MEDVYEYEYRPIEKWDAATGSSVTSQVEQRHTSTLGEVLNIPPDHPDKDQPIVLLGCGNSRFGEEMIQKGWRGPIIQVDVSRRVIDSMSQRCSNLISNGHMNFVQDDACELSAFRDGIIDGCLDKGLIDAIFCAEDHTQLSKILRSVARILRPGGSFVFFSFSRPEFLLPKLMVEELQDMRTRQWTNIQVQELSKILLYKMEKIDVNSGQTLKFNSHRPRKDKYR
jgi:ubiquinone/menaquinone biosynthesis C-methylase UbiE